MLEANEHLYTLLAKNYGLVPLPFDKVTSILPRSLSITKDPTNNHFYTRIFGGTIIKKAMFGVLCKDNSKYTSLINTDPLSGCHIQSKVIVNKHFTKGNNIKYKNHIMDRNIDLYDNNNNIYNLSDIVESDEPVIYIGQSSTTGITEDNNTNDITLKYIIISTYVLFYI